MGNLMLVHFIEPVATMLAVHSDSVRILADINSGDGTSNGAIWRIAQKVSGAAAVIIGIAYLVHITRVSMAKEQQGGGKTKGLMEETKAFALAEGLCSIVFVVATLAAEVAGGAAS